MVPNTYEYGETVSETTFSVDRTRYEKPFQWMGFDNWSYEIDKCLNYVDPENNDLYLDLIEDFKEILEDMELDQEFYLLDFETLEH